MATRLKIGPNDHGRRFTPEEVESADYAGGHKYEIIDGTIYVSPQPNQPTARVESWALFKLHEYRVERPDVINFVYNKARVFVPGQPEETVPEPDVVAYHDYPLDLPSGEVRWQDVSPVLVVEVISSKDEEDKDLVRNPRLYRLVRSIREYWVLDPREDEERPALTVYRRQGRRWEQLPDIAGGGTYTTPLLPGFTLTLNIRA